MNCIDCNKTIVKRGALRCKSCATRVVKTGTRHSDEARAKISRGLTGKVLSADAREKISKCQIGRVPSIEKRRAISLSKGGNGELDKRYPNLHAWKRRNKERTQFCEWCYSEDDLHAHHIIPKSKFPQYHDEDWNCRILCKDCHKTCHIQGGY